MHVTTGGKHCSRDTKQVIGPHLPIYKCGANDASTALAVVMERVIYHEIRPGEFVLPVQVSKNTVDPILSLAKSTVCRCMHQLLPTIVPEDRVSFLAHYHGRRLGVYTRAANEYEAGGLSKKSSIVTAFVKNEKLPSKARVVPRLIQPRKPLYNYALGRYLRGIEPYFYKAIQLMFKSNIPVISKGFNAVDTAHILKAHVDKVSRFGKFACIGLDASRFDQHITRGLLEWEHSIYNSLYPHCVELRRLLRMQLVTHGHVQSDTSHIKYKSCGRCSGDMNTALGNCLISSAMLFSYLGTLHIPLNKVGAMINGDDVIVIVPTEYEEQFVHSLPEFYGQVGLVMKVEAPVHTLESITFCQTQCIQRSDGPIMVRSFPAAFGKDLTFIQRIPDVDYLRRYCHTLGVGGKPLGQGVPIYEELYRWLESHHTHGVGEQILEGSGFWWMSRNISTTAKITDDVRVSFWRAFGVTPDAQVAIEEDIHSWPLLSLTY